MKFNSHLSKIEVYEAGKPIELIVREFGISPEQVIKMASNENPFGMSPKVAKKLAENSSKGYLYPDDSMFELKEGLAQRFQVDSSNIIIGAGSDQVLDFISRAKLTSSSKVLMNRVTFAMYEIYANLVGAKVLKTDSTHHDLEQFYQIYKNERPDTIFICTPNNPTGDAIERDELYRFLEKIDSETLVVVDGAYMEYAEKRNPNFKIEPSELIDKFPNSIYLGTFSKAFGLGGMRVGYGIAQRDIIQNLYKVRPPFNITTLSLLAGVEALKDMEHVWKSVEINFQEMEKFEKFADEVGFQYIESATNFITLLLPERYNSSNISNELLRMGIIIRDLKGYGLNGVRVTIGKPEENIRFFELFQNVL
ncbi:MAG TPA: histidinol-phosphate transaminase [Campylobacterales bacterium]|nr:histidinol-phosphate transaminase [Campylobacterales bacterium]